MDTHQNLEDGLESKIQLSEDQSYCISCRNYVNSKRLDRVVRYVHTAFVRAQQRPTAFLIAGPAGRCEKRSVVALRNVFPFLSIIPWQDALGRVIRCEPGQQFPIKG
jgi:hypothetical protein